MVETERVKIEKEAVEEVESVVASRVKKILRKKQKNLSLSLNSGLSLSFLMIFPLLWFFPLRNLKIL